MYGIHSDKIMVDGKKVTYGVVNEREVRIVAGFMFALGLTTLLTTMFTQNFMLATVVLPLFLIEFLAKIFVGPQASFLAVPLRRLICNMEPEWVGAIQKRFAWTLGALFATTILFLIFALGIRGPVVLILCSICLLLMWLESAAGICLGCNMYAKLVEGGYIKPLVGGPKCAGGVCEV